MDNDFNELDGLMEEEETYDILTMIDDDGNECNFFVVDGIEVEGVNYLLIVDHEKYEEEDTPEAFLIKETASEGEELIYEFVEDDNEYNKVMILLQENDPDYELDF